MMEAPKSELANYKKKKDEQKKKQNGEMAPDVDENGKMINPHNPEFITKVPWYLGKTKCIYIGYKHIYFIINRIAMINEKLTTRYNIRK